jgi:hypothetical protein
MRFGWLHPTLYSPVRAMPVTPGLWFVRAWTWLYEVSSFVAADQLAPPSVDRSWRSRFCVKSLKTAFRRATSPSKGPKRNEG